MMATATVPMRAIVMSFAMRRYMSQLSVRSNGLPGYEYLLGRLVLNESPIPRYYSPVGVEKNLIRTGGKCVYQRHILLGRGMLELL